MKKVTVSVINDLVTDQRVHKVCCTLRDMGFEVTLIGREQRKSLPLGQRPYRTIRMKLLWEKGVLFYFFFNLRLFLRLLFTSSDVLVANDLDTLWPNWVISRWKKIPLVYDSHEIFTEVPELTGRRLKQGIWRKLESMIFPKLRYVITVNDSIASWFENRYGKRPAVVRNMPRRKTAPVLPLTRAQKGLPQTGKMILLQGAGINIDRGSEELVEAMRKVDDAFLCIVGGGDVIPLLKDMVKKSGMDNKVFFIGKVPPDELRAWTHLADLGVTLDKPTNINYRLSLPNKIFDYLHAGVPVLSSDLPEVASVVRKWNVGFVVEEVTAQKVAEGINAALSHKDYGLWQENALKASEVLCWEKEEQVLRDMYSRFLS